MLYIKEENLESKFAFASVCIKKLEKNPLKMKNTLFMAEVEYWVQGG